MTILNAVVHGAVSTAVPYHRRLRVSAAGKPFIAVLRRLPGGGAVKVAKVSGSSREDVPFMPPNYFNVDTVASYFKVWPRRRAAFVMYGGEDGGNATGKAGGGALASAPSAMSRRAFSTAAESSSASAAEAAGSGSSNSSAASDAHPYATLGQPPSSARAAGAGATKTGVRPFSTADLARKFQRQEPLTMVTAYDCGGGYLAACANIDMVLVGDSLGMVVLGNDGTVGVTCVVRMRMRMYLR
jgi:hypothetical protein